MKKTKILFRFTAILTLLMVVLTSCDEKLTSFDVVYSDPVITDFSPKVGSIGDEITIIGENLTKVNSVKVGGGEATILYRISSTEMIVKVASTSRTGKIEATYDAGDAGVYKGESNDAFTVNYQIPTLTSFPTTAKANDQVLLEGSDLDAAISVYFGTAEATIVYQSDKELLVQVPFILEDGKVDIKLTYNNESGIAEGGTTDKPFELYKPLPTITSFPTTAFVGASITLAGTNLSQVDTVMIGDYRALISSRSEIELVVSVPGEYTQTVTVPLKIIYHKNKSMVLTNSFVVDASNLSKVHFWESRTIYARSTETPNNFFNAITGDIYTPCEYENAKNDIYLLMTISGSAMRIGNPNNSTAVTNGYSCNSVKLPAERMPRNVRLRRLLESNPQELAIINAVKAKTIDSISVQQFTDLGINLSTASGYCDYKGGAAGETTNLYEVGSVILMMEKGIQGQTPDNNAPTIKVGLVHITGIETTNPVSDTKSSITFNCYYEK